MAFWSIAALRTILDTETDADSPGSEELLSQVRENIEALLMLAFAAAAASTCTSDPSNDANGYFYDTVPAWTDDQHNGRTLLILSGSAKGTMYTIDDTDDATDRLACTGDNLYADGVRSGDSYIILFDVKVNVDGHDHDGVNSKTVILADAVISQAKLKTTTGSVNTSSTSLTNLTLPGGEYGFYPQLKSSGTGSTVTAQIASVFTPNPPTTYITKIALSTGNIGYAAYAQQRYVQSSGEVHWVFLQRDKATGKIISGFQAPDHPCFGNGGDPVKLPHPFPGTDPLTQEILVIALDPAEVKNMKAQNPDKDLLEIVAEKYTVDEKTLPYWPDQPVTVGLPPDWDEAWLERTPVVPIKKVIPKPEGMIIASLKMKSEIPKET